LSGAPRASFAGIVAEFARLGLFIAIEKEDLAQ
jgi:hypothetical protein